MKKQVQKDGYLIFEDGRLFYGDLFFGQKSGIGEAVFNTSSSGYQEILSDPSYYGQVMTFTTPHIGNVGINPDDMESTRAQISGMVVRNLSTQYSNWRAKGGLIEWLEEFDVPVLVGADTRSITRFIRSHGAQRCGIFSSTVKSEDALKLVLASPDMNGANLAKVVSGKEAREFSPSEESPFHITSDLGKGLTVALVDFGVKQNIIRELTGRGCSVKVFPHDTCARDLLKSNADGVLLSNGPGDPAAVTYAVDTTRNLIGKIPLFGICLGHQILSLAAGYRTFKLEFGHRGANHPVKRLKNDRIEITSQNHGFAVEINDKVKGWDISHINLNDNTVEGVRHQNYPAFSLQYHPESSPGPHDSLDYFDTFIREMKNAKTK